MKYDPHDQPLQHDCCSMAYMQWEMQRDILYIYLFGIVAGCTLDENMEELGSENNSVSVT